MMCKYIFVSDCGILFCFCPFRTFVLLSSFPQGVALGYALVALSGRWRRGASPQGVALGYVLVALSGRMRVVAHAVGHGKVFCRVCSVIDIIVFHITFCFLMFNIPVFYGAGLAAERCTYLI